MNNRTFLLILGGMILMTMKNYGMEVNWEAVAVEAVFQIGLSPAACENHLQKFYQAFEQLSNAKRLDIFSMAILKAHNNNQLIGQLCVALKYVKDENVLKKLYACANRYKKEPTPAEIKSETQDTANRSPAASARESSNGLKTADSRPQTPNRGPVLKAMPESSTVSSSPAMNSARTTPRPRENSQPDIRAQLAAITASVSAESPRRLRRTNSARLSNTITQDIVKKLEDKHSESGNN